MVSSQSPRRRLRIALLRGLVAPACLCLGQWADGAAEPPPAPAIIAAPAQVQVLDLAACRSIALERQPAIAAAQASVAAAQVRVAGLHKLHAIPLVAGDLPIRRQQAALGVAGAEAQLEQARWDALYDVTRTYLTAVYARQQLKVADDAQRELTKLKEEASTAGKDRVAEQITVYIKVVQGRRETAQEGVERALAALREATGLGADACITVADTKLPDLTPAVCRDDVIALALSRRGEMVQAATAAEVTGFEVKAQESKRLSPSFRTFASASDIHAQPVPQAGRGIEYHPGAVGPEMPTTLVGKRAERVEQARALSARADAVADKTRGLIALEADDAFHKWQETARRLPRARDAADSQKALADKLAKDAKDPNLDVRFSEAMAANALASQLRLEANEAHLQHLLNLATLERVTAGGFSAGFVPAPATHP
jgi:outer membrane protein TolC